MKQKVLLYTGYHDNAIFYSVVSPPIGLYRLKNYLERRDIDCDVFDLGLTDGDFGNSLSKISEGHYDVIGVSVDTEKMGKNFDMLIDIRKRIENSGKKIMFVCGGQGATHEYKTWIKHGKLDAVLLGFAEKNFYELCKSFFNDRNADVKKYASEINGVAYPTNKDRTQFIKHPSKPLTEKEFEELNYHEIKDLYIPYQDYWNYTHREGAASLNLKKDEDDKKADTQKFFVETIRLYTSSHCPWKCGFCNSHSFLRVSNATTEKENKIIKIKDGQDKVSMNELVTCGPQPHPVYRIYPDQIFDLIQRHCDKYDPRVFLFNDDAFWDGSNEGFKHIMDLCDLIIDAKKKGRIKKHVIFNCQAKIGDFIIKKPIRMIHEELIMKLKEAGFYHFGTGVETFSDKLLKTQSINKKAISEADQHMVIQALLKHGFSPSVNLILFIPESNIEDIMNTMKTATDYMLKGTQVAVTPLLRPNAGSGIWELITKNLTPIKAKYAEWLNPETNEIFKYPLYCIPLNEQLANFIEQFDIKDYEDMENLSRGEQHRITTIAKWKSKVVPRPVTALSVFITLSRYLERYDMVEYFEKAVFEILGRNLKSSPKQSLEAKESLIL